MSIEYRTVGWRWVRAQTRATAEIRGGVGSGTGTPGSQGLPGARRAHSTAVQGAVTICRSGSLAYDTKADQPTVVLG